MEKVILVDGNDLEIGSEEKIKAHREGKLHRSFSVFVFNSEGKLLMQKRTSSKYHSGGLWSNTCCSHPRPGEKVVDAAHRRLKEEMGFDCALSELFTFVYKVKFANGLSENEFDHVLMGKFDGTPKPDPEEAESFRWIDPDELRSDMGKNPDGYTYWLKEALKKFPESFWKNL